MRRKSKKTSLPQIGREARIFIAAIAGVILTVSLIGTYTWFGPDPSNVIRSSSSKVPSLSFLSKEETVAELRKIAMTQSYNAEKVTLELTDDGALKIFRKSDGSDYESTKIVSLSQLDAFFYAQQQPKGERIWDINVFCANYQQCINGSNNRADSDFTLNADTIFWIEPYGDVRQIIGLLNQLLGLHGAQSTIDTSKNTIRISQEYWRRLIEDSSRREP